MQANWHYKLAQPEEQERLQSEENSVEEKEDYCMYVIIVVDGAKQGQTLTKGLGI